jgi:hypothetical protein
LYYQNPGGEKNETEKVLEEIMDRKFSNLATIYKSAD